MARKILVLLILSFASTMLVSCGSGFGPQGGAFTMTKIGLYGTDVQYQKKGEACNYQYLSLISYGDGSIEAAAKSASISKVNMVDLHSLSILGIYSHLCTVVKGE